MTDCERGLSELQDFIWQNCRGIIKLEEGGPEEDLRLGTARVVEVVARG